MQPLVWFEKLDATTDLVIPTHHTYNPQDLNLWSSKMQITIDHKPFESLKRRQKYGS